MATLLVPAASATFGDPPRGPCDIHPRGVEGGLGLPGDHVSAAALVCVWVCVRVCALSVSETIITQNREALKLTSVSTAGPGHQPDRFGAGPLSWEPSISLPGAPP